VSYGASLWETPFGEDASDARPLSA
jgi:hypothetical protein